PIEAHDDLIDHALHVGPAADIANHHERFAAGFGYRLGGRVGGAFVDVVDGDAITRRGELERDAAADPASAAGHQRDAAAPRPGRVTSILLSHPADPPTPARAPPAVSAGPRATRVQYLRSHLPCEGCPGARLLAATLLWTPTCSPGSRQPPSSASNRWPCRSKWTCRRGCPASRWSVCRMRRCGKAAIACARPFATPASRFPAIASRSVWRRP